MVLHQIWYQSVCLFLLSVYQISRQLDNAFVNFHTLTKRRKKQTKKLSQFSKVHISETPGAIEDIGWHFHCKNCFVSFKFHRTTYMWKLHFFLPVNNSRVWRACFLGCTTHYYNMLRQNFDGQKFSTLRFMVYKKYHDRIFILWYQLAITREKGTQDVIVHCNFYW